MGKHFRTIDKAASEILAADPNTAITKWMLSLPETWHFSLEGIYAWAVKYGHKAGETAIKNAIHSLESAGYLYRSPEKVRGADGRWLAENWEVFERPQDNPH